MVASLFPSRLQLLAGLMTGEKAYAGPAWLTLDVTHRCNCVCLGCSCRSAMQRQHSFGNPTSGDLPFEIVEKLCRELPAWKCQLISLAGQGEPLLHPRIFELIASFQKAGVDVLLSTNGILLDDAVAERLCDSGLDRLHITFWAADHEEHTEWHPGLNPAFLELRMEAISHVVEARRKRGRVKPRVFVHLPLTRSAVRNIEKRIQMALQTPCDGVSLDYFRAWGGPLEPFALRPEDVEAERKNFETAAARLDAAGKVHNIYELLTRTERLRSYGRIPCHAGWFQIYVLVDGTLAACTHCSLIIGDLKRQSFAEIWNGSPLREFRRVGANPERLKFAAGCDCVNCCAMKDNLRVERIFRWFRPFAKRVS